MLRGLLRWVWEGFKEGVGVVFCICGVSLKCSETIEFYEEIAVSPLKTPQSPHFLSDFPV